MGCSDILVHRKIFSGPPRNVSGLCLGLPKTFRVVPKSPCVVLSFINLLEGEPSALSEVLRALDHVFIKYIAGIFSFHSSIIPDQSFSPGC